MGLFFDRVRQAVSAAPGTGGVALGAATSGLYRTFAQAGATDGQTLNYVLEDGTAWEYGVGTYSTTGPSIARTTIIGSSTGGSAINASSAATIYCDAFAKDFVALSGGGGLTLAALDVLTASSGTWAKPSGIVMVYLELIGPGAGGASGSRGSNAASRGGGGGAGGGAVYRTWLPASFFAASCAYQCPAGGQGGAAQTADNSGGNLVGIFSSTTFVMNGDMTIAAPPGNLPNPGSLTGNANGGGQRVNLIEVQAPNCGGGTGGFGGNGGSPASVGVTGPGGGGGGGGSSTTAGFAGGGGAKSSMGGHQGAVSAAANGGAVGANAADGGAAAPPLYGAGGGGGGSSVTGQGGNGGAGGIPGGGGGGGGSSLNGFLSGAGGNGGRGEIRIYSYK